MSHAPTCAHCGARLWRDQLGRWKNDAGRQLCNPAVNAAQRHEPKQPAATAGRA